MIIRVKLISFKVSDDEIFTSKLIRPEFEFKKRFKQSLAVLDKFL